MGIERLGKKCKARVRQGEAKPPGPGLFKRALVTTMPVKKVSLKKKGGQQSLRGCLVPGGRREIRKKQLNRIDRGATSIKLRWAEKKEDRSSITMAIAPGTPECKESVMY